MHKKLVLFGHVEWLAIEDVDMFLVFHYVHNEYWAYRMVSY
jgi:hypothetical protein